MYNVYPLTGFKLDWTSTAKPVPKCGCNEIGTEEETCESETEKCKCKPNYTGEKCEKCSGDYWMSSNGKFNSTNSNVLITDILEVCSYAI